MKIENYDNRRPDFAKLYEEGRPELFIQGVADAYAGEQAHRPMRPRSPVLQISVIPTGQVHVWGETFPYKDHLKRLGGKWHAELKSWAFPADASTAIKADPDLNSTEDLWSGVPPKLMKAALESWKVATEEYGRGYVHGQEIAGKQSIGRLSR